MGDGNRCATGGPPGVRAGIPSGDLPAGAGVGADEARADLGGTVVGLTVAIPITIPTLNVFIRMHWAKRRKLQEEVAWILQAAIDSATRRGRQVHRAEWIAKIPLKHCRIRIVRHSRREPDPDGLDSTAKLILDALQPCSKTHPFGLGIIENDNRECIGKPEVVHAKGSNATVITITEVRHDRSRNGSAPQ